MYESKEMTDCLGRLVYVADRQLFAVVTADAGCGKPTLIHKFSASLPKEKLKSTFGSMTFYKIKFHRGVEFNFASELKFFICENSVSLLENSSKNFYN